MGHKNVYDVNSVADFWSFLSLGLTPLLFGDSLDVSEVRANVRSACDSSRDQHRLLAAASLADWGFAPAADRDGLEDRLASFGMDSCPEPASPKLEEDALAMYLYYNRMIGGLRLRQERTDPVPCAHGDQELAE